MGTIFYSSFTLGHFEFFFFESLFNTEYNTKISQKLNDK